MYQKTYDAVAQVPESSSSATAILCGVKTNSPVIAVDERAVRGNCELFKSLNGLLE